jgi:lipopolysaccharide transport system ATP-binding protein
MSKAIKVENLSKIYRLGEIGTGTITRDIDRWFKTKVMGKADPFLKIGESNDRAKKGISDIVYSLQDINFEINQGDAVGIIGRNGAGKSTLLKILSRVTTPSAGKINIKGRVASLLEVGTGFHPELTGRENIYLNGAILGMRKREIDRKLDEIIDFSGVERYIDTPVKRYSSGMYVRLAFAVAAHLESEILIVDEVLAVGDAEFQKKCLGKMGEVSKGEGRTVLFVSHNFSAIRELTSQSIFLQNGKVEYYGITKESLDRYINQNTQHVVGNSYTSDNWSEFNAPHLNGEVEIFKVEVLANSGIFKEGDKINFQIGLSEKIGKEFNNLCLGLRLMNNLDSPIGTWFSEPNIHLYPNTSEFFEFEIYSIDVAPGKYYFTAWIGEGDYKAYSVDFHCVDRVMFIEVIPNGNTNNLPVWYEDSWGYSVFKNMSRK